MLSHIEQYLSKEQSISSYCKLNSIKDYVFHYWYRKFKKLQSKSGSEATGFVEVSMPTNHTAVEVRMCNGSVCNFSSLPPIEYLRKLMTV